MSHNYKCLCEVILQWMLTNLLRFVIRTHFCLICFTFQSLNTSDENFFWNSLLNALKLNESFMKNVFFLFCTSNAFCLWIKTNRHTTGLSSDSSECKANSADRTGSRAHTTTNSIRCRTSWVNFLYFRVECFTRKIWSMLNLTLWSWEFLAVLCNKNKLIVIIQEIDLFWKLFTYS